MTVVVAASEVDAGAYLLRHDPVIVEQRILFEDSIELFSQLGPLLKNGLSYHKL